VNYYNGVIGDGGKTGPAKKAFSLLHNCFYRPKKMDTPIAAYLSKFSTGPKDI
jgi:hypothetical protein